MNECIRSSDAPWCRKDVALVGHFPFISRLRKAVRNLGVIEQHPTGDGFSAESASDPVPRADVAALTAGALVNHTLNRLLALCSPKALVMILRPGTPLSPVLFDHGATINSGSRVLDEAFVLNCTGQGAIFQQVRGLRLLAFTRPFSSPI